MAAEAEETIDRFFPVLSVFSASGGTANIALYRVAGIEQRSLAEMYAICFQWACELVQQRQRETAASA